jgi:hypothetical protein
MIVLCIILLYTFTLPHMCYMLHPSNFSQFDVFLTVSQLLQGFTSMTAALLHYLDLYIKHLSTEAQNKQWNKQIKEAITEVPISYIFTFLHSWNMIFFFFLLKITPLNNLPSEEFVIQVSP